MFKYVSFKYRLNISLFFPPAVTFSLQPHAFCAVLSCSVMSNSLQPHGLQPTRLLCSWGLSRQEYWSGLPCPPPGGLPNPGNKPRSPSLQADSLPSEPPWKPENAGVDSLSLLPGNFPTQEQNRSLLHCRWMLYQLRQLGNPLFYPKFKYSKDNKKTTAKNLRLVI